MKSLVTGGAGFIGSNLVDRLIEIGHEVIVIDNESSDAHNLEHYPYKNESAQYHKIDICDYEMTRSLYDNVDYVFHLAAESRIQSSIENPIKTVQVNDLGTSIVLQCSREAGVKRVMYSSTSAAYGLKNELPNVETQPTDCLNPYSVTKVNGENLCKMYTDLFGLPTVIFRYFNVYGERQPSTGPYAPVMGVFYRQSIFGQPLTICGDGKQRRDFVHVADICKANILAATADVDESCFGQIYNVGTGINYSVNEIADMIDKFQVNIAPRKGEAKESLANCDKIKETFGWSPDIKMQEWLDKSKHYVHWNNG